MDNQRARELLKAERARIEELASDKYGQDAWNKKR